MSQELKTLNGKFHSTKTGAIEHTELSLNRFWGGEEGTKVQLTLSTENQDDFFTHITLDKHEIKKLISELLTVI